MCNSVNLILGTMTFGQQTFGEDAAEMINTCMQHGISEFDTAYVYNEGESERILGKILPDMQRNSYKIATKVNPRITGKLDGDAVNMQLNESLSRMNIDKADIYYLHFPDRNTPVESALEACAKAHEQGKFTELGLSNFPAWLVADVYHKCKVHGWVVPTVYEGVYNAVSRKAEGELFDALHEFGLRFYAYNPLAGGMLTGKYTSIENLPKDGRFGCRKTYQNRYWRESYFDAVNVIKKACDDENILMTDAALRWMAHHSLLDGERGDGIIVGASRISQLKQNIDAVNQPKLPETVIGAFDRAWEICAWDAPAYYRFY